MLTYVSLGAGVQSSALLVLAALGERGCPRADLAIFADTQDEPDWVYAHLAVMEQFARAHGLEVVRVTAGRLADETLGLTGKKRRAALPVFTRGADGDVAMLPRQCTEEYKLQPIRRELLRRFGRRPKPGSVEALIGLSFDERVRMKDSCRRWIVNRWPLIEAAITRSGCVSILEAHGLPMPQKSACIYCPFHDDAYWRTLRQREPHNFAEACAFDEAIRSSSSRGSRAPVYLHRSLQPLREVVFADDAPRLDFGFANECEGACGV